MARGGSEAVQRVPGVISTMKTSPQRLQTLPRGSQAVPNTENPVQKVSQIEIPGSRYPYGGSKTGNFLNLGGPRRSPMAFPCQKPHARGSKPSKPPGFPQIDGSCT